MGHALLAGLCVVASLFLMSFVVKRYGSGDVPATWGETGTLVTLWAVTIGPTMYLNPRMSQVGVWNPSIPLADKIIYWVLLLLSVLIFTRTVTAAGSLGRKVLTLFCGFILGIVVFLVFGAIFGVRALE